MPKVNVVCYCDSLKFKNLIEAKDYEALQTKYTISRGNIRGKTVFIIAKKSKGLDTNYTTKLEQLDVPEALIKIFNEMADEAEEEEE